MNVTHEINLDFARRESRKQVYAVRGDNASRIVKIALFEQGEPWPVPEGVDAVLRFQKADGTGGFYDTLPDGTKAWSAQDNEIVWTLAPQVLSCPGAVICQLALMQGEVCLSSFSFDVLVEQAADADAVDSEAYYNWSRKFIEAPHAAVGQIIRVKTVDSQGMPAQWEAADLPAVPGELPNPHKLSFTGAVSADYDGSASVSVEIPLPGGDFGLYGLGETSNHLLIPSDYALVSIRQTGWYSIELGYGTVDFGDGWTANKFLLRVESGESEQYSNVTKQTAIFASYPGAEEFVRYCKNGSDWTAWEKVIHQPKALSFKGAVEGTYDGSEAMEVEIPAGGGGLVRVLLWENADTISEFNRQTVQLDELPEYDAIEIVYAASGFPGGYGRCYLSSGMLPKLTGTAMDTEYYQDGYALTAVADFYYPGDERKYRLLSWEGAGITFEDCTNISSGGVLNTDNFSLIPARIYGIKGVQ